MEIKSGVSNVVMTMKSTLGETGGIRVGKTGGVEVENDFFSLPSF